MKVTKKYQEQIRTELFRNDWEIIEIDADTDWWVERHWKLRSTAKEFGFTLFLSFLVDPLTTDSGKSPLISEVLASTVKPGSLLDRTKAVAELDMRKGQFAEKLKAFMQEINRYRDGLALSRHPGQR